MTLVFIMYTSAFLSLIISIFSFKALSKDVDNVGFLLLSILSIFGIIVLLVLSITFNVNTVSSNNVVTQLKRQHYDVIQAEQGNAIIRLDGKIYECKLADVPGLGWSIVKKDDCERRVALSPTDLREK